MLFGQDLGRRHQRRLMPLRRQPAPPPQRLPSCQSPHRLAGGGASAGRVHIARISSSTRACAGVSSRGIRRSRQDLFSHAEGDARRDAAPPSVRPAGAARGRAPRRPGAAGLRHTHPMFPGSGYRAAPPANPPARIALARPREWIGILAVSSIRLKRTLRTTCWLSPSVSG